MSVKRSVSAVALAAMAMTVLASCGASSDTVTISRTDTRATLNVGDVLRIDFGEVNSSVGDAWVLVTPPDTSVLSSGELHSEPLSEEGLPGAPSELFYTFVAKGNGTTTIEFQYEFRGSVPDDAEAQESASIKITVN